MERTQFDDIWDNILTNQKESFTTSTGEPFTYSIVDYDWIYPDHIREKHPIQKKELRKIFIQRAKGEEYALSNTPSYTCAWAIIHDKRVRSVTKNSPLKLDTDTRKRNVSKQWFCSWNSERIKVQFRTELKGYYDLLKKPYCTKCSFPGITNKLCTSHEDMYNIEKIYALGEFTPRKPWSFLSRHIYGLKNHGWYQESLGKALGLLIKNKHPELMTLDYVTPVPSHKTKRTEKGFNQVDLIISHLQNLVTYKKLDCLKQVKNIEMRKLSQPARFNSVMDMFEFKQEYSGTIVGKKVLLIDDVVTTGATVSECSRVLSKNGARSVTVLTLGRTRWDSY
jgi:competence protein ComFC